MGWPLFIPSLVLVALACVISLARAQGPYYNSLSADEQARVDERVLDGCGSLTDPAVVDDFDCCGQEDTAIVFLNDNSLLARPSFTGLAKISSDVAAKDPLCAGSSNDLPVVCLGGLYAASESDLNNDQPSPCPAGFQCPEFVTCKGGESLERFFWLKH
jgi:hypothetical protein